MNRKECLEKAMETVCNDREETYGKTEDNFKLIANLWSAYKGTEFSSKDVAVMMALLKIARIKTGKHKDDNFVDLAGYAACACEVGELYKVGKNHIEGFIDGVKGIRKQIHKDLNKKPKFVLEDYQDDYVMHCDTEEKAEKFCQFLDNQGKKWTSGLRYVNDTFWRIHEEDTCYDFKKGCFDDIEYYQKENCTILEFDDFDWEE